jgi:hypothetical protein
MHLFLLVPNNSGSTLLHDLIATSSSVATLPTEGQFHHNFVGPDPIKLNVKHFFTIKEETFKNKKNYEWSIIKNSWNGSWKKNNNNASIFLQKSPTDIVRAEMLLEQFSDARFIMMIRNPYAVVEGILRGNPDALIEDAAQHALRCLEIQLENSEKYQNDLVLRYEDLTEDTENVVNNIMNYLQINDISYQQEFSIKGYCSRIKNMNIEQIKRLTDTQIKSINKIFSLKLDVLQECGYDLIDIDNFNFKFIDKIDITELKNKVNKFNNSIWKDYTFRQDEFVVHKDTNTIPLIFSEDFNSENVIYHDAFNKFSDELLNIIPAIIKSYGFGFITRAILVKLPAGETIPFHIDAGESLHAGHRIHLPVISNNMCKFTVDNETIVMNEGELWEINNTNKMHSVQNLGNNDRVHMIIDWITID